MKFRLAVWLLLVISVSLLGAWGFSLANPETTPATSLYASIQLFVLNSGGDLAGAVPWQLELARWMAPVLSGALAIGGILALASDLRERLRARFLRSNHTVVVGLGSKGLNLASDLVASRRGVVGLDRDPAVVRAARAGGIAALQADILRPETLAIAGLKRARRIVFLTKTGEDNVLAALQIAGHGHGATCYAHVPSIEQRNLLYRQNVLGHGPSRIRLFNYFESLARLTLARYPIEALHLAGDGIQHPILGVIDSPVCGPIPPHVFIRPSVHFTEAFCAAIARTVHLPLSGERKWNKVQVTLVDEGAEKWCNSIRRLHPQIDNVIDLKSLVPPPHESAAQAIGHAVASLQLECPVTVILDLENVSTAFCEALAVADIAVPHSEGHSRPLRCIFDFSDNPAIQSVIADDRRLGGVLLPLPSFVECCGARSLFDDQVDALAKLVHQKYGGVPLWDELTAELQESNRAVANHIPVVLRATGRSPEGIMDPEFRWADAELEALAETEHRRWSAQKWLDGWRSDPSLDEGQDKAAKRHGCLAKSYAELSEEMKERDRDNVRIMGELLRELERSGKE